MVWKFFSSYSGRLNKFILGSKKLIHIINIYCNRALDLTILRYFQGLDHCKRRWVKQNELCKRASFHSNMGLSNNAIYRKLLNFSISSFEQKMFLLNMYRYPWWAGPVRPGRNALWHVIFQSVQKIQTQYYDKMWSLVFETDVSNFEPKIFIGLEIIAFLEKPVFCHLFIHFWI